MCNSVQLKVEFYLEVMNFFLFLRLNINKIAARLIIINKLAFVNEISNAPNLISGPIL